MTGFKRIKPNEICGNFFDKIGKEWMLITAKDNETGKFNMMTASWGTVGIMWSKPVLTCVIRPHRYTREFTDKSDVATFTFYDEKYRNALQFCGTKSGRDFDKTAETGLTPCEENDAVYFNEANLVIIGRKMYVGEYRESEFIDTKAAEQWYPEKDYHIVYTYEITDVLIKENKL